jgi:hypothetical protein
MGVRDLMFGWCWHRWGSWVDSEVIMAWTGKKVQGQIRYCAKCNLSQWRNL